MLVTTFSSRLALVVTSILSLTKLTACTPYSLTYSYSGATFFNNFNFVTSDPSGGWVSYVDQGTAQGLGYASASSSGAYLGVDYTNVYNPGGAGRQSVRIESKSSFTTGLFIGDFQHMPVGCGLWPAFWMYGPDWPNNGEIDIIEGVNNQVTNQVSGHTNPGCVIAGTNSRAPMYQNTCYQADNSGCYFKALGLNSYGSGFNSVGGGVYAMEWTDSGISVWHWKRSTIPSNIINNQPDPSTWGEPMAMFYGSGCSIPQHFNQMKIVLNTDFCGGWAQSQWGGCPGSSCIDYVAANPQAFTNAYWQVNYINVYNAPLSSFAALSAPAGSKANSTTPESEQSSPAAILPLASTIPDYTAPAGAAMGATKTAIIGPAPTASKGRRRGHQMKRHFNINGL